MRKIINQKGMTLVEMLIVAAIMGVVSIGFATIFSNAFKKEANLTAKQSSREFRDEIEYGLASYNCGLPTNFFYTDGDSTKDPLFDIKDDKKEISLNSVAIAGPRGAAIAVDTVYYQMTVKAISIAPFLAALNMQFSTMLFPERDWQLMKDAAYTQIVTGQPYYSAEIRVTLEKPQGAATTPSKPEYIVSRHFIILTTNNTTDKKVIGCQSYRYISDAKSLCQTNIINGAAGVWNEPGTGYDDAIGLFTCSHEVSSETSEESIAHLKFDNQSKTTSLKETMETPP